MVQVMPHIASMGIYVIKASVMRELLLNAYADANDFGSEIIPGAVAMGKRVQAYLFEGYWEDIGTIGAFYSSQLGLLKDNAPFSFYDLQAPIFSMSRYLPPSRINVCIPCRGHNFPLPLALHVSAHHALLTVCTAVKCAVFLPQTRAVC
jgi:ADP-glucose pyrophosphorylase